MHWAASAQALVRGGIHAQLSGLPEDKQSGIPCELEPLAVLLDECTDLLAFRDAEHKAVFDHLAHQRDAALAQAAVPKDTALQNEQFNYALAVEALHAVQGDPDATCVEAPNAHAVDAEALRAEHTATVERLRAEHHETLEQLRAEHAAAVASLAEEHATALVAAKASHTSERKALEAEYIALSEEMQTDHVFALEDMRKAHEAEQSEAQSTFFTTMDTLHKKHATELAEVRAERDSARAQLAETSRALDTQRASVADLEAQLESIHAALQANDKVLATVRRRVEGLDEVHAQLASSRVAIASLTAAHQQTQDSLALEKERATSAADAAADAERRFAEREAAFHAKTQRLHEAERRLGELQRDVERTREVQANVDTLQQRAEHAESEAVALREQLRVTEPMRAQTAQLQSEVQELQTLVSMHKSSAEHAAQEHVHAEEKIKEITAKAFVTEHTLRERDAEVETLKEARRRHTEQIRMLRAAEKEMRAVRAPDHAAELHERIAQLELELSAKAEEIEEADTRILHALKDNKRLATQNKALQARLDGPKERALPFQDRTNTRAAPAPEPGKSPVKKVERAERAAIRPGVL